MISTRFGAQFFATESFPAVCTRLAAGSVDVAKAEEGLAWCTSRGGGGGSLSQDPVNIVRTRRCLCKGGHDSLQTSKSATRRCCSLSHSHQTAQRLNVSVTHTRTSHVWVGCLVPLRHHVQRSDLLLRAVPQSIHAPFPHPPPIGTSGVPHPPRSWSAAKAGVPATRPVCSPHKKRSRVFGSGPAEAP